MNSMDQQIFSNLKNLFPEFKCSLQDLRNPTEEFVTNFYTFWLSEFGADISNVNQVQFAQSNIVLQYHDTYIGVVPKVNLLKCMRWFEIIPDFGILDIVSPTPKRTQNIIKSLIEFFQWADDRVCSIQDKKMDLNQRKVELTKLMRDKQNWKEKLNSITINIATLQGDKQKMEAEIVHLQQKASDLKMDKQKAKAMIDECNEKLKEKEAVLLKLKKEEAVVTSKIKEYSNQVVDSPSSILVDMDNLRLKSKELSEMEEMKKKMVEEKMQGHQKMGDTVVMIQKLFSELKDLLKQINEHRKLNRKKSATDTEVMECQEKLEQLKQMLIAVTKKKRRKQKALEALHLQWTTVKPKLMENLEDIKKELEEKRSMKNKMVNSLKEDGAVEEKCESLLIKIKQFCEDFDKGLQLFRKTRGDELDQLASEAQSCIEDVRKKVNDKYPIDSKKM